jgi:DNA-binding NarL/FixJ family response regulator
MNSLAQLIASTSLPQSSPMLRVAVAGRDAVARAGVIAIAEMFDDIVVVDDAADVVVSFDASLARRVGVPVLVLLDDANRAAEAIAAGAKGAIARDSSPRQLHAALLAIGEGLIVTDRDVVHRDAEPLTEPLTAREDDVLQLLASGLTNKEIASRLGITDHTVKFHVNAILGKLAAETRTEAVVHAAKLGIVVL